MFFISFSRLIHSTTVCLQVCVYVCMYTVCMSGAPPCGQIENRVVTHIFHKYPTRGNKAKTKQKNKTKKPPHKQTKTTSEKSSGRKHKILFAKTQQIKIKVQYILKTFSLQNNFTEITLECIFLFFIFMFLIYIVLYLMCFFCSLNSPMSVLNDVQYRPFFL